ncbi:MAG: hypothetical protein GY820_38010 [Gammaproteobacteria bacterium]|nr:hypothetical protein [Gammaproteobacteria bacterium]
MGSYPVFILRTNEGNVPQGQRRQEKGERKVKRVSELMSQLASKNAYHDKPFHVTDIQNPVTSVRDCLRIRVV